MDQQVQACVVDATTLSDHIHEIKKLIYDGQIRLTVPLSTFESVEKIYQKSIEPKPEPKEATRPKSSGRPVKVYPTFDINPRVTQEFLARCKLKESKLGVEFQQDTEEYSPWKALKEQEEKQKAPDAKPAGYAAALLAKLDNEKAPVPTSKGPLKPKLVARSPNGPNNAWKKTVPAISVEGISPTLRSIIGYTLWRLHERETYSFVKDASILLTDDKETSMAGKRAGINVQTFSTLLHHVSKQVVSDTDVGSWGDVERDFGVCPPSKAASVKEYGRPNDEHASKDKVDQEANSQPALHVKEELLSLETREDGVIKPDIQGTADIQEETIPIQEPLLEIELPKEGRNLSDTTVESKSVDKLQEISEIKEAPADCAQQAQAEAMPPRPRAWADVVSNRIRPIEERYPPPVLSTLEPMDPVEDSLDTSTVRVIDQFDQEKTNNIFDWMNTVQANVDGDIKPVGNRSNRKRSPRNKKTEKPSPPQEPPAKPFRPILMQRTPKSSQAASDRAQHTSEKAHSPSPSSSALPAQQGSNEHPLTQESEAVREVVATPPPHSSEMNEQSVESPPTQLAEVVQTNPQHRSSESTRSSAHTVASKDTSVAKSAPVEETVDSEEEVVVFNPRAKRLSAQQHNHKPAPEEEPVLAQQVNGVKPSHSKHLSLEGPIITENQPLEKPLLVTIPTKQYRQPKPKAEPVVIDPDAFGRDFASNPQASQQYGRHRPHSRPHSQHGPPRPVPQYGLPRGGGAVRGGRPFIHPQALPPMQNGHTNHMNGNARGGRHNRMPPMNGQKAYPAMNQNNVAVNSPVAPQAPPNASLISAQQASQTDVPEPDVDFVLQSGPSRGSTRGRGRLWIP